MTSAEIKRIVSGMGYSTDVDETGFNRFKDIRHISMYSNMNQSINRYTDFINFDFKNHLIKIKEYDCKMINGMLRQDYIKKENKLIFTSPLSKKTHPLFKTPEPKELDIVYFVDKKTKKRISSLDTTIKNITKSFNETIYDLENAPDEIYNYFICFVDPADFNREFSDGTFTSFLPYDETMLFVYKPRTKYNTDIYIDIEGIAAISMVSEKFNI